MLCEFRFILLKSDWCFRVGKRQMWHKSWCIIISCTICGGQCYELGLLQLSGQSADNLSVLNGQMIRLRLWRGDSGILGRIGLQRTWLHWESFGNAGEDFCNALTLPSSMQDPNAVLDGNVITLHQLVVSVVVLEQYMLNWSVFNLSLSHWRWLAYFVKIQMWNNI